MEYIKELGNCEGRYYLDENDGSIKRNQSNEQSSYNLPNDFFRDALNKKVIIEDPSINHCRKSIDGNAYVVNSDYKFKLGQGVIWLIGEKYNNDKNKFIASINGSNKKAQLYRRVYKELESIEYNWFIDLYDKNIVKNILVLNIDEENKILTLDTRFNIEK